MLLGYRPGAGVLNAAADDGGWQHHCVWQRQQRVDGLCGWTASRWLLHRQQRAQGAATCAGEAVCGPYYSPAMWRGSVCRSPARLSGVQKSRQAYQSRCVSHTLQLHSTNVSLQGNLGCTALSADSATLRGTRSISKMTCTHARQDGTGARGGACRREGRERARVQVVRRTRCRVMPWPRACRPQCTHSGTRSSAPHTRVAEAPPVGCRGRLTWPGRTAHA